MVITRTTALVSAVLVAFAAACAPNPATMPGPPGFGPGVTANVVVYGDSLTVESAGAITQRITSALPGWKVTVRAYGGTAQCDWHGHMRDDRDRIRPAIVVLAFSGNQLTPCAKGRAYPQMYGADARWAQGLWVPAGSSAALVTIGAPPRVGDATNTTAAEYATAAAANPRVAHRDTSRVFVDPATGVAAHHLGCAAGFDRDCVDGAVQVRHPDGAHLCPDAHTVSCNPNRPGVARYSSEIAAAVAAVAWHKAPTFPDATSAPHT